MKARQLSMHALSIGGIAALASVCLSSGAMASPTAPRSELAELAARAQVFTHHSHVSPWIKRHLVATPSAPLVYVSIISNGSGDGQTNIYQQQGSTLSLVGQLSHGGGPVAVDKQGNLWVTDVGTLSGAVARNVYVFAPNSTTPTKTLHPDCYVWAIAIGADGTAYFAGPSPSISGNPAVVIKYAPSASTGTTLAIDRVKPYNSYGLAVDKDGNIFAGWTTRINPATQYARRPCLSANGLWGCVDEYPAGASAWKTLLGSGGPVNEIQGGPAIGAGGTMAISTTNSTGLVAGSAPSLDSLLVFENILKFAPGSKVPSQVLSLDASKIQIQSLVYDADGTSLWAANALLDSSLPYQIWKLNAKGKVVFSYPLPVSWKGSQPLAGFIAANGIAVSPAYYPAS